MKKSYLIFLISILFAEEGLEEPPSSTSQLKDYRLDKIYSVDIRDVDKYQSGEEITSRMIEDNPSGNGDITSLLRILPNVQYDNRQNSSRTPGEIDPANIVISGGLYYQNAFLIDGMGMNNDLNPIGTNNPTAITALPGASQGLNIDTSLLEKIEVLDSNISASYGGFSGGVVEVKTKRPSKKIGAKISAQITQGDIQGFSLTKYHLYNDNIDPLLISNTAANQPKFFKYILRGSIESKVNDRFGLIANLTTIQSYIPLKGYAKNDDPITDSNNKIQRRQSYNAFFKFYYDIASNVRLEASYTYAPQYNQYFIPRAKDSEFYLLSGGHQVGIKTLWDNALGNFSVSYNFNYLENSRTGSKLDFKGWHYSTDKNWNAQGDNLEGGYGNVRSLQLQNILKLQQEFNVIKYKWWSNQLSAGIEIGYTYANYHRPKDTIFSGVAFTKPLMSSQNCTPGDEFCSNGKVDEDKLPNNLKKKRNNGWENNNGQYMYKATLYKRGIIDLGSFNLGSFIQDEMSFVLGRGGEIQSRLGLREDFDTLMQKFTLAPRFSLKYITPVKRQWQTHLIFGANRYYGRNLFAYALADGQSSLEYDLMKSSYGQSWDQASATSKGTNTNFKKLKVPYADELMGGIYQNIAMFALSAKYIHRFGRDEIRKDCDGPRNSAGVCFKQPYTFRNAGRSETDVVSLSIQNNIPVGNAWNKNYFLFAFDFTNTKRNYGDYNEILNNPQLQNMLISYGGKIIPYADKPADNYIKPFTLRLNTTHSFYFYRMKWTINNFFRYRSSYLTVASVAKKFQDKVIIDGKEMFVDTFKPYRVKGAFTWDMRIGFEVDFYHKNTLFVNLDIYNLLDAKNIAIANVSYAGASASLTATPTYEVGRSFYIEVGYQY